MFFAEIEQAQKCIVLHIFVVQHWQAGSQQECKEAAKVWILNKQLLLLLKQSAKSEQIWQLVSNNFLKMV